MRKSPESLVDEIITISPSDEEKRSDSSNSEIQFSTSKNEQQIKSELTGNELVGELWPGAEDVFHEIETKRNYPPRNHDLFLYSEEELFNIGNEIGVMLDDANSFSDVFKVLKKVDGEVFNFKWDGEIFTDSKYWSYDDSPLESDEFRFCMQNMLLPVLHKMEDVLINSDEEEKTKATAELTNHILENYKYNGWYFDRAKEVCTTMLKIDGIKALPKVKEVTEYITEIPKLSDDDIRDLEVEGIFIDCQDDESYYDPIFLEFDDPDHRQFTAPITKSIVNYPWREGEEKEVSKFLTDYLSINSLGNLDIFVDAFQKFGVENATKYLLDNLKSDDVLTRRMSAEILYRLELGKMGVDDKGVEYLGKLYDLGKYNDPDFFVRRLNNSGLMAILAEDGGNIEGVFPLDLYADGDVIRAEIRQLMSQELFLPRADETQEQRQQREYYLQLFLENYENIFNDGFFEDVGVRLNSLDLHEQGWFLLHYLELSKQENTKELERLKSFVSEYGEYGLKSFLALEYGGSGEDIIAFSENDSISKEHKLAIFKNFYCIANEAMNWRKIFEEVEGGLDYKFSIEAYESLIRKNAEFFKAAQIISEGPDNEKLMFEVFSHMNSVAKSLKSLEGFYNNCSGLKVVGKPTIHDEYGDNGELIKGVRHSWVFESTTGDRVAVSVRTKNTIEKNGIKGGGPRINFKITNPTTKIVTRVGFDLSYYNVLMGEGDTPLVSLDLGVLDPRFAEVDYSTEAVGRVLSLVEGSEGGHNEDSFNRDPDVAKHFEDIANSFIEYINKSIQV